MPSFEQTVGPVVERRVSASSTPKCGWAWFVLEVAPTTPERICLDRTQQAFACKCGRRKDREGTDAREVWPMPALN